MSDNNDNTTNNIQVVEEDEKKEEKKRERFCSVCRRPESKTGPLVTLTPDMCVCNDCMHKTLDYMQNGKINPVSGIFLMKNNMGYEDKTEMVVTPNQPLGDQKQPEQLEEYLNTIDSE